MELYILVQVAMFLILVWVLKHLVHFYKGVLTEKNENAPFLTLMKVAVPLAILGLVSQVVVISISMMKALGFI